MPVYRISNKQIIISPKRSFFSTALITSVLGTGFLALALRRLTESKSEEVFLMAEDSLMASPMIAERGAETISQTISTGFAPWHWFLIGAWLGIVLFFSITFITERRKTK